MIHCLRLRKAIGHFKVQSSQNKRDTCSNKSAFWFIFNAKLGMSLKTAEDALNRLTSSVLVLQFKAEALPCLASNLQPEVLRLPP